MKVAVIGAGVVGMIAAHYLCKAGHDVSVIDREDGPARKTSKANGAQLSYSYTDAMASPRLIAKLPGILLGKDRAFRISPSSDPAFLLWGVQFLRNCTPGRSVANTLSLQRTALESAKLMEEFGGQMSSSVQHRKAGKLVLLPSMPDGRARSILRQKSELGCDVRIIDPEDIFAIEPVIRDWNLDVQAAVYSSMDDVGDPYFFAEQLCQKLEANGVRFHWGEAVKKIVTGGKCVEGIETESMSQNFDAVIVCTGRDDAGILKPFSIRLPILPIAGYSITLPSTRQSPNVSVTAQAEKIVMCKLGESVRIAGFADINTAPSTHDSRIRELIQCAKNIAPQSADFLEDNVKAWMGYRPVTPNSLPICSATKIVGLYLNMGHGMLGWTLSAATGSLITTMLGTQV